MSSGTPHRFEHPVRARGAWAAWWRRWYRFVRLAGPVIERLTLGRGYGNYVILRVMGRRTGRERSVPLGLLTVGERRYLGHPSGDTAWTLNLRATRLAVIEGADVRRWTFRPVLLEAGTERDAAVEASFRQHPFPGSLLYRLAGSHVRDTGVFFRLEEAEGEPPHPPVVGV